MYPPKKKDETTEERNPFADASGTVNAEEDTLGADMLGGKVHIRIQQCNGHKCMTTVAGLSSKLELKKIQRAVKKELCCNGKVLKEGDQHEDASSRSCSRRGFATRTTSRCTVSRSLYRALGWLLKRRSVRTCDRARSRGARVVGAHSGRRR